MPTLVQVRRHIGNRTGHAGIFAEEFWCADMAYLLTGCQSSHSQHPQAQREGLVGTSEHRYLPNKPKMSGMTGLQVSQQHNFCFSLVALAPRFAAQCDPKTQALVPMKVLAVIATVFANVLRKHPHTTDLCCHLPARRCDCRRDRTCEKQ